jgi:hypothetical protein
MSTLIYDYLLPLVGPQQAASLAQMFVIGPSA